MTRLRSLLQVVFLGLAAAGAGAACTDVNSSLYIVHNLVPNDDCSVPASSNVYRATGTLDVDARVPYFFTPEVKNGASASGNTSTRVVFLAGADTELLAAPTVASQNLLAGLDASLRARTQVFSGAVSPNGGTTGAAFPIIDADQVGALAGGVGADVQVIARVTVFGTQDDKEVESAPFDYPITLCNGCIADPEPGETVCPFFHNQL